MAGAAAVGQLVALLQHVHDRIGFLFSIDHGNRLVLVRVKLFTGGRVFYFHAERSKALSNCFCVSSTPERKAAASTAVSVRASIQAVANGTSSRGRISRRQTCAPWSHLRRHGGASSRRQPLGAQEGILQLGDLCFGSSRRPSGVSSWAALAAGAASVRFSSVTASMLSFSGVC